MVRMRVIHLSIQQVLTRKLKKNACHNKMSRLFSLWFVKFSEMYSSLSGLMYSKPLASMSFYYSLKY